MPGSDEDLRSACDGQTSCGYLRNATGYDLEDRRPCNYCFPEADTTDEIDQPIDDLVVVPGRQVIHRHEDTGPLDYQRHHSGNSDLVDALSDPDVTDPIDLPDGLLGGDA